MQKEETKIIEATIPKVLHDDVKQKLRSKYCIQNSVSELVRYLLTHWAYGERIE